MKYCEKCGTQLSDNAKFCSACGSPCKAADAREIARTCKSCGAQLDRGDRFCPACGKERGVSSMDESRKSDFTKPSAAITDNADGAARINYFCLLLLVGCIILWLTAPFMAINFLTFGDQPTALQILIGDVLHIGELTRTAAFWAALLSIVGIVICVIATFSTAHLTAQIVAIVTELPLLWAVIDMIAWMDYWEEVFEIFGFGFWGMLVLLFVVACTGEMGKNQ